MKMERCRNCNGVINPMVQKNVIRAGEKKILNKDGETFDIIPFGWKHVDCYGEAVK